MGQEDFVSGRLPHTYPHFRHCEGRVRLASSPPYPHLLFPRAFYELPWAFILILSLMRVLVDEQFEPPFCCAGDDERKRGTETGGVDFLCVGQPRQSAVDVVEERPLKFS